MAGGLGAGVWSFCNFWISLSKKEDKTRPKALEESVHVRNPESSVSFAGCWVGDWRALGFEGRVVCVQREGNIKHRPAAEWLEQWVRGAQDGSRS